MSEDQATPVAAPAPATSTSSRSSTSSRPTSTSSKTSTTVTKGSTSTSPTSSSSSSSISSTTTSYLPAEQCSACPANRFDDGWFAYELPDGTRCNECSIADGVADRYPPPTGSWDDGYGCGGQCLDFDGAPTDNCNDLAPQPIDAEGKPGGVCIGQGGRPDSQLCLDYCNALLSQSHQSGATVCSQNTYNTGVKCSGCYSAAWGAMPYITQLRSWCMDNKCIDISTGQNMQGSKCQLRVNGQSIASSRSSSQSSQKGGSISTAGQPVSTRLVTNTAGITVGTVVVAADGSTVSQAGPDSAHAEPAGTASVKTITNSDGQVLGTVVVDDSGNTGSQVFAISTTNANGMPTLSFTTSTLTATFIPNTRFGVIQDTSTTTSDSVRLQKLPPAILYMFLGAVPMIGLFR